MAPDRRLADIARRQHGVFALRQARDLGYTSGQIRHRIETGRWIVLHRGVCAIAGTPSSYRRMVMAAVLSYGPMAMASHLTAAFMLGIFTSVDGPIHVMLPHSQHRRHKRGIVPHQVKSLPTDLVTIDGIPTTSAHRTLVDLASIVSRRRIEAALDRAVIAKLETIRSMRRYVEDRHLERRRGIGTLMRALDDRDAFGTPESGLERLFIEKARKSGLPEPMRQIPCGRRRIDLGYPDSKIAIEVDCLATHSDAKVFEDDRIRQNELGLEGWFPLRFTENQIKNDWPKVHETVAAYLADRTQRSALKT
jgi:very-short-patch-repair endonuclease